MKYDEALAWLDAHSNLEANAGWVHGLSLEAMRGITSVLGDPHLAAPVIHVTGTNGKGSVVRMISAVLAAHGLSVGTYTSPHLESVNERIRRNDEPIPDADLAEMLSELAALEPLFPTRPSWFELVTAAAFSWFAHEAVDVVVLEVGLLGRFDATNVAEADVAVITNVGLDHTDGKGDWAATVATEKAGIIDPASAVVIGEADPRLVEIFRAEGGRSHWVAGTDFGVETGRLALGGRVIDVRTPHGRIEEILVPLHGDHQADNAAVALAAVEAFFDRALDRDVVADALAGLVVPGRFEVVAHKPLVVLDAAHNRDGAAVLADTWADEFRIEGALTMVLGVLRRPLLEDVLAELMRTGPARVVCTTPGSPRAMPGDELADRIRALAPAVEVAVVDDVPSAVLDAVSAAGEDGAVVVCGSLYTVGPARGALVPR